ncbi:cache domain-containing sensor histidine kinase [Salibacterium halotolerans]|uniref:Two-component system, sensor histidine kinase YesM n=1 Tax=Salibacterium halotolerans TaxID=1884432 RepID=A0A1I5XTA0_9BACI|nr:sensor histidine kinase [Salibacterium halotolerans]SFQ35144.1 two-component system, sensor histidine kinase YesM [Salibacterium halotolerans]
MELFKKYKIQNIFFISFFLFVTVLLVIIICVTYQLSARENITTTMAHQEEKLKLLGEDLSSELTNYHETSIGMSRQNAFHNFLRGAGESEYEKRRLRSSMNLDFSNITYSVPGLHSVSIYMKEPPVNGPHPVRYHSLSALPGSWEEKLQNTSAAWLGERSVQLSFNFENEEVVSYGRNVYSASGELQAVLVLNIKISFIQEWMQNRSERSRLMLMDGETSVLSRTTSLSIPDETRDYMEETAMRFQEENGLTDTAARQEGHLVVSAAVPSADWTLIEVTPMEELTAGSRELTGWLVLIGAVSIIAAFFATLYLTKRFTDPIVYLTKVLNQYPLKSIPAEIPDDYRNEFGQLFQGYRQLMYRSDMLYQSLIDNNRRQRKAEIRALQANINPHFLYNTLDQLNWRAMERGDDDMSRMMELLGKMLRIGLSKGESIISVQQEIDYVHHYLELQKIKMEDALSYEVIIYAPVETFLIPKLTLQPFVENAVIHGLSDTEDGVIKLTVSETAGSIRFDITDNGPGLSPQSATSTINAGGYGIRNVKERLHLYFGEKAVISLQNLKEGGVAAVISIPKIQDTSFFDQSDEHYLELERERGAKCGKS